jgi:hypothetical protein
MINNFDKIPLQFMTKLEVSLFPRFVNRNSNMQITDYYPSIILSLYKEVSQQVFQRDTLMYVFFVCLIIEINNNLKEMFLLLDFQYIMIFLNQKK